MIGWQDYSNNDSASRIDPGPWCGDYSLLLEPSSQRWALAPSELEPNPGDVVRLLLIALTVWLFTTTAGFADSEDTLMAALGFYITGETGADVLDSIIPELARVGFY